MKIAYQNILSTAQNEVSIEANKLVSNIANLEEYKHYAKDVREALEAMEMVIRLVEDKER